MPSRLRRVSARVASLCGRLLRDDAGQDLIEYAFITAFFGIAGWVALGSLGATVHDTYSSWIDPASGTPSLWQPPEPSAGGGT